jgi:16S rRNA (cytidine1402-2'-O)-methyltransferase
VIYESPHALSDTLTSLLAVLEPERTVVVAKELTKLHEAVFRGSITAAQQAFSGELRGEYVLIVDAVPKKDAEEVSDEEILEALQELIAAGMTKKDAAKAASDTFGISKNRAYKLTL